MECAVSVQWGIIWLQMEHAPQCHKDAYKWQTIIKGARHAFKVMCFKEVSATKSTRTVSCTTNRRDSADNA